MNRQKEGRGAFIAGSRSLDHLEIAIAAAAATNTNAAANTNSNTDRNTNTNTNMSTIVGSHHFVWQLFKQYQHILQTLPKAEQLQMLRNGSWCWLWALVLVFVFVWVLT